MDDMVFEMNNLLIRLGELRKMYRDAEKEGISEEAADSKIMLWKSLENAILEHIRRSGKEVSSAEVIYVLSAFLSWHLEKALKQYYNYQNQGV